MSTRDALEESRVFRAQVKLGRSIWLRERRVHVKDKGPGYLRWTDSDALRIVGAVIGQALDAGCRWDDVERAIIIVAERAQGSPRHIFDTALNVMTDRENDARREQVEHERAEGYEGPPLPKLGRMP